MHRPKVELQIKRPFPIPAILCLAVTASLSLSACGIKGDLKRPKPIFDKSKLSAPLTPISPPSRPTPAPSSSDNN